MKPLPDCRLHPIYRRGRGPRGARRARCATGYDRACASASFDTNTLDCWLGEVRDFDVPLAGALAAWDCRNNRLADFALEQDGFLDAVAACRARYGAARIGVFIGTSTSGVQQTELAYRARDPEIERAARLVRPRRNPEHVLRRGFRARCGSGLRGPALAISTACSSSAKVFAAARRAIAAGVCDAAVVGGVDSLCLTTLYGFNSLQLISADICRPADSARNGISIGEAGGFALLDREAGSPLRAARLRRDPAMRTTCRRPSRKAAARSHRCARRWRARTPHRRRRLHQPARHRHARERQRRKPRRVRGVRHRNALQLDQGLDRPHARRGRHRRSRDQRCWPSSMACCRAASTRA